MTEIVDIQAALKDTKSFVVPPNLMTIKNSKKLIVKGQEVEMTPQAWKDLLNMVGMTKKMTNHLNSSLKGNSGYALIQHLMKALKKSSGVKLYIDESSYKVVRIVDADYAAGSAVSADAIQELIEMAERSSGGQVALRDQFVSDGGTKVTFNFKYDREIPLIIPNEEISLGKQLVWDLLGPVEFSDFVERLICTNGMTAVVPGENRVFLDGGSSTSDWYNQLFSDLNNPDEGLIKQYERGIVRAKQSVLSIREADMVEGLLRTNWSSDQDKIDAVFGTGGWRKAYERKGHDLAVMTDAQKRNCRTPFNAWDAINLMTDLASHNYNSDVSDATRRKTQEKAGKIMNSAWDDEAIVDNLPSVEELERWAKRN